MGSSVPPTRCHSYASWMYGNAIPASKQIVIPMKVNRIILVVPFDWRSSSRSSFLDWTNQRFFKLILTCLHPSFGLTTTTCNCGRGAKGTTSATRETSPRTVRKSTPRGPAFSGSHGRSTFVSRRNPRCRAGRSAGPYSACPADHIDYRRQRAFSFRTLAWHQG